jgi:hypothetical protein
MIHLLVMRSPRIESTSPAGTDEVIAESGGIVRLRCSALGNPKPVITWRRIDGSPLRILLKDGTTRKGEKQLGKSNSWQLVTAIACYSGSWLQR